MIKTVLKVWSVITLVLLMQAVTLAQTPVTDIDTAQFRTLFNANSGKVRIVAILDALCPGCIGHSNDLRNVIYNQCDNPNLTAMIVWLKTTGFTTVKADAQTQADTWNDSRAEHYWATNTDEFPDAFGTFSWMSCNYPWDISMLFDSGGMWSGTEPISPDHCTAKISGCCNSYNINNMKAAVEGLNACTVVLGTADEKLGEPLIRIVPNPSTGLFTIDLAEKIQDNIEVSVINIIGQKSTAPINIVSDQSLELDLSDYPNGTYFISVKGRSHSLTYKVMKHQGSN